MNVERHPRDSLGRPLPDGSWPDRPGDAGGLEVVRRFANTINREHEADAWRSPAELRAWLHREGHAEPNARVTRRDLARAIELRDALHRAIRDTELAPLGPVLAGVRLAAVVVDHDLVLGASGGGPVDLVAARLVSAVLQARHDGSWTRLKTCHHCGWVFYDTSKNRSGRWCSMQACGGRAKARAYRRRVVAVSRPAARG